MEVHKAELELKGTTAALKRNAEETAYNAKDRAQKLADLRTMIAGCDMKTRIPGLVLIGNTWDEAAGTDRKFRVGDKPWEGQGVAQIIDPGRMVVACDISEADVDRVHVGQPATVTVEALGNTRLNGKVAERGQRLPPRSFWEGGTTKRIFRVTIKPTEHDVELRPGMTGTAEIAVERA